MASIGEQIIQAVKSTLEATDPQKPVGLTVHRNDAIPIDKDQLPALVVYPNTEDLIVSDHSSVERPMRFIVEARAKAAIAIGESPDEALDPLFVFTVQKLMADRSLGGLCAGVLERRRGWDREVVDGVHGTLFMEFEAPHFTALNDPTTMP